MENQNTDSILSVIVPVYNVEKYLARCIDSILSQSYQSLEIILVDDGSTDSSGQICDTYAAKYRQIKVIHQKNQGLSAARNAALKIARGEYYSFIDSDDVLLPDSYSPNMDILLRNPQFSFLQFPYIYPYGDKCAEKKLCYSGEFNGEESFLQLLSTGQMNGAVWNKIYHRSLFDDLKFRKGLIFEDTYLHVDLASKGLRFCNSKFGGYGYCRHSGSIMSSKDSFRKYHDRIIVYNHWLSSTKRYASLSSYSFLIYQDLIFYYLGILQCEDKSDFDQELQSAIYDLEKYSFSWSQLKASVALPQRKKILFFVKILGLKRFVKLYQLIKLR
ncbi:glycosyltransferase [Bacteroides finegoldii]|jgi:glycosyltransferase, group 2 family protein